MNFCRSSVARAHQLRSWIRFPHPQRPRRTGNSRQPDQGSSTVEMVLIAPVLMVLILLVVYAGRLSQTNSQVRHASDQAARAASLVNHDKQVGAASAAALQDLANNGVGCVSPSVTISATRIGQSDAVTATVSCSVNRSEMAPLAPGNQRIVASSTEVIDRRRGGGVTP
jgi:Flp pilus assembly protein TadG